METVTKSNELRRLGWKVIRKHEDLHWIKESDIKIGYVVSDKAKKKDDRIIFAECHKVKAIYKAYIDYDFIIVFYEPHTMLMDDKQLEILMYHELLHVGMEDNGTLKLVPHDIEDFKCILDEYGLDWNAPREGV